MVDIPTTLDEDADHFARLAARRRLRDRMHTAFLEKAARFSQPRRRWFRVKEIESDEIAREELIRKWRASIYSGDLLHKGKSQVLCLYPSPFLDGYRYPPVLARDAEAFNKVVDDLWMSARRWLEWFSHVGVRPPQWMMPEDELDAGEQFSKLPTKPPRQRTPARAYQCLLTLFPDRKIPKRYTDDKLANMATRAGKERLGINILFGRDDIRRARGVKR
jgi:hypothetical protein